MDLLSFQYKVNLEEMKKREDRYGIILNYIDIGDLWVSQNNINLGQEMYNNGLDSIFFDYQVIKKWREMKSNNNSKYINVKNCLMAINLLGKLSQYCYYNNQYMLRECLLFASFLSDSIYREGLPHPQSLFYQANYKMQRFQMENSIELIRSIHFIILSLYDLQKYDQALGLANIMEMISKFYLKNNRLIVRSKIFKALIQAELGFINQTIAQLYSIKDYKQLDNAYQQHQITQFYLAEQGDNYANKNIIY